MPTPAARTIIKRGAYYAYERRGRKGRRREYRRRMRAAKRQLGGQRKHVAGREHVRT